MLTTGNHSGVVDCSVLEVVYCERLAADDFIWTVRVPVSEFANFLFRPANWVASLGQCDQWRSHDQARMPAPTLAQPLQISIRRPVNPLLSADKVLIHGISGTGYVDVSPGAASAFFLIGIAIPELRPFLEERFTRSRLYASYDAFWGKFLSTRKRSLHIFADDDEGTFNGHLSIWDQNDAATWDKPTLLSTFLLTAFNDPDGYQNMLDNCALTIDEVQGGNLQIGRPPTSQQDLPRFFELSDDTLVFHYTSDGSTNAEACDIVDGSFVDPFGTVLNSTVKDYAP
ncbi:MAG TPA: hypothetical protein VHE55_08605 [Fimbriimonadaceae bacterium]|nr:hypothetical protein [Fimbriimonadaceae bacterium]